MSNSFWTSLLLLSLLFVIGTANNRYEDLEIIKLVCTHSGNAFVLDNMESIELQATTDKKSIQKLTASYLDQYITNCSAAINVQDALNVRSYCEKIVFFAWDTVA